MRSRSRVEISIHHIDPRTDRKLNSLETIQSRHVIPVPVSLQRIELCVEPLVQLRSNKVREIVPLPEIFDIRVSDRFKFGLGVLVVGILGQNLFKYALRFRKTLIGLVFTPRPRGCDVRVVEEADIRHRFASSQGEPRDVLAKRDVGSKPVDESVDDAEERFVKKTGKNGVATLTAPDQYWIMPTGPNMVFSS